jgi:hypothetical protein
LQELKAPASSSEAMAREGNKRLMPGDTPVAAAAVAKDEHRTVKLSPGALHRPSALLCDNFGKAWNGPMPVLGCKKRTTGVHGVGR